jgi:hypothetical protein
VHLDDVLVREQVGRVLLQRRLLGVEQPADVRVPEALEQRADALAVLVRGVRVAGLVAVRVVAPVVGDPADDRALDGETR